MRRQPLLVNVMRFIDLTGIRYGKLRVISHIPHTRKWGCICDCGKNSIVFSSNLKRGNTLSCGCLNDHNRFLDNTLSSKKELYSAYKRSAKARGLSFAIDFDTFLDMAMQNCCYCGEPPSKFHKLRTGRKGFLYNGLDRLNNDRGYELDNVAACCIDCNRAKWDRNKDDFVNWIRKCYKHLKSKGVYEGY
jgi:5-methylcytosine-specific restriction endonuclease McrA